MEVLGVQILVENRGGIEVVDGNIEEALNLLGVEVEGQDPVRAGGDQEVGHQLGGNGNAGLVLPVLARVTEEGDHGRDPIRTGTAGRVQHDEQFHQVVVGGRAGGLDNENIISPDIVLVADKGLSIGKGIDGGVSQFDLQIGGDRIGEGPVGGAGKNL
jgi:hypothetical protein